MLFLRTLLVHVTSSTTSVIFGLKPTLVCLPSLSLCWEMNGQIHTNTPGSRQLLARANITFQSLLGWRASKHWQSKNNVGLGVWFFGFGWFFFLPAPLQVLRECLLRVCSNDQASFQTYCWKLHQGGVEHSKEHTQVLLATPMPSIPWWHG